MGFIVSLPHKGFLKQSIAGYLVPEKNIFLYIDSSKINKLFWLIQK